MSLVNIQQVSNLSSFYRETQNSYLPSIAYGNHFSFFHSGGAINNIAYEEQYPASIFAKTLEQKYINIVSFQQFIQKQLVYLEQCSKSFYASSVSIGTGKLFLKQFFDLFAQFFALHYQAPKLVVHIDLIEETNILKELGFEFTLSPQNKIFVGFTEDTYSLSYRNGQYLKKVEINSENLLENFADIFAQYGTQHDLTVRSSVFK
jgi:hypothetical protein